MSYEGKYPCIDTAALHAKLAELEEKVNNSNNEEEEIDEEFHG